MEHKYYNIYFIIIFVSESYEWKNEKLKLTVNNFTNIELKYSKSEKRYLFKWHVHYGQTNSVRVKVCWRLLRHYIYAGSLGPCRRVVSLSWLGRVWNFTHEGSLTADPVVFLPKQLFVNFMSRKEFCLFHDTSRKDVVIKEHFYLFISSFFKRENH